MNGIAIFLIINFSVAALFAATAGSVGLGIAALLVAEGTVYYLYDRAQRKKKELEKPLCNIELVTIDTEGRLFVRPKLLRSEYFTHIYRDDSGVEWADDMHALWAAEPYKWEHLALFKQIFAAVLNEYGQRLVVTPDTRWSNVSDELRKKMEAWSAVQLIEGNPKY